MSGPFTVLVFAGLFAGCGRSSEPTEVAVAETRAATLRVEGMTCGGCESSISVAAKAVAGVVSIDVSHETGSAELSYDAARTDPEAVAAAITALGYPTTVQSATVAAVSGPDPAIAAICQAGCAAQEDYDPADVVAQPSAKVGDLTRCPVSGVVFRVKPDQPVYQKDGRAWYTCCGMCMGKLVEDPARFLSGA